ncbi:hypothetical protein GCM10009735_80070 [Actinomadura chokoriensis]
MTNDGQQPTSRPNPGLRDPGSWVIIDDLEDTRAADSGTPTRPTAQGTPCVPPIAAAPAPPTPPPPPTAPTPPPPRPLNVPGGWDTFARATSWSGVPVAPPGRGAAPPPPTGIQRQFGTPAAGSEPGAGHEEYRTADPAPLDTYGSYAAAVDPVASGADATDVWFPGDGTEDGTYQGAHRDDAFWGPAPTPRAAGRRMSWTGSRGTLVTVFVACLGVLLVIASAVWHPQAP